MAKRKHEDSNVDNSAEYGYIHNVSPIKISRSNSRYFNCDLQSENKFMRLVSFAPEKHDSFSKAEVMKSPVKLNNVKCVPGRDGKIDVQVNRHSSLEVMKTLSFNRRVVPSAVTTAASNYTNTPIKDIDRKLSHQMYNITGKVLGFTTPEEVQVKLYNATKKKKTCIVGDETGKIYVDLFEDLIKQVEEGKTYQFAHLSSRIYGQLSLTTTTYSKISAATEINEISSLLMTVPSEKISGTIQNVQCSMKYKCACQNSIDMDQSGAATFIRCNNCGMKSLISSLEQQLSIRMTFVTFDGTTYRLVIFSDVFKSFLEKEQLSNLLNDMDSLEEYLLQLPKVVITKNVDSDIVNLIKTTTESTDTAGK